MSQTVKRDAETAFEDAVNGSSHTVKRQRKRKTRKSVDQNESGSSKTESTPTRAPKSAETTPLIKSGTQDSNTSNPGPTTLERPKDPSNPDSKKTVLAEPRKKDGLDILNTSTDKDRGALIKIDKKKKKARKSHDNLGRQSKSKSRDVNQGGWTISPGSGGMFIDQDPLLTDDDQYLVHATHSGIQVYATKTSLLVRSFRVDNKPDITSCSFSGSDPTKLYVSNGRGLVSLCNWTTGVKLGEADTGMGLQQVLPLRSWEGKELVLLLQEEPQRKRSAVVYSVDTSSGEFSEMDTILRKTDLLPCIRSYAQGTVLIACAGASLLIGQFTGSIDDKLDLTYTWREISLSETITCFDGQVNSGKSKSSRKTPFLDVVVGLSKGAILQYEDLLFKLIAKEKKNSVEDVLARKLHWHRAAVNSVKWSRDRNYIISGGSETVLVIWQLDSNQKQFLPHLSTPILGLSISAEGSAYALRLGDNSLMILSTADLLPSTNVSGLALGEARLGFSSMALHPKNPNQLLASVPADAAVSGQRRGKSSTLLQIYDLEANLQLGRQALTRNMTTALNVGPAGQLVREPDVTHIAISHDGKWLATVDEWQPNEQDLSGLFIDSDGPKLRGQSTETCLRFWVWNGDERSWELVTRVDEPHQSGHHSVLGLAFNPTKVEAATIGSDATVRFWSPKARHRNGVSVRNRSNEQLYTWTGTRTVRCDHDAAGEIDASTSAALSFSDDGSVLAVSWAWSSSSSRTVHLIDPTTGKICASQPDLVAGTFAKMAFKGRYLLCLSQNLTVLDTLTGQTVTSIALEPEYVAPASHSPSHIATNKFDGTVAFSISRSDRPRGAKFVILSLLGPPTEWKPVYENSFPGPVKGLLALTSGPGYLIVDERNRYQFLRPTGLGATGPSRALQGGNKETDQVTKSLDSIFGPDLGIARNAGPSVPSPEEQAGADPTSATPASAGGLDTILKVVSSASAPSPAELFQRVLGALRRG